MTDRELLELAVKAMGFPVAHNAFGMEKNHGIFSFYIDGKLWNPLTDDGDALRLAAKLHINITCAENFSGAKPFYGGKGFDFPTFEDPYEATRRVIVRAAAEIGKGME